MMTDDRRIRTGKAKTYIFQKTVNCRVIIPLITAQLVMAMMKVAVLVFNVCMIAGYGWVLQLYHGQFFSECLSE